MSNSYLLLALLAAVVVAAAYLYLGLLDFSVGVTGRIVKVGARRMDERASWLYDRCVLVWA